MENKQNKKGTWLANHSTNLLATLYIILVLGVLAILTLINECSVIWTGKEVQWAITGTKYVKLASDKLKDICDKGIE